MDPNKIDSLLFSKNTTHKKGHADKYIDHFLEQYRIYIQIFNSTNDRRNKANEFFLGLNTAIIGILGYLETKGKTGSDSVIFLFAPFVGVAICYAWFKIIKTYRHINQAKFKVIHSIEKELPVSLFRTEWELLKDGRKENKYYPLSLTESKIPLIFIFLYVAIFIANLSLDFITNII